MSEPGVPEPLSLEDMSRRRAAWTRAVPVALTVAIFLFIFWRIPFGAFWQALSRAQLLPFLGAYRCPFWLYRSYW